MQKRVFIVHGWGDYPQKDWLPWLKERLEDVDFEVSIPAMPNPNEPTIDAWIRYLASEVGTPDQDTYFVGHSIGCQTILRYLETIDASIGGAVFVAGWFTLSDLETEEEKIIGKPWIETPIDFAHVRRICSKMIAIFCDDDPVVPFEPNRAAYREHLNPTFVIEHSKGHFTADDGATELPSALQAVLEMAN